MDKERKYLKTDREMILEISRFERIQTGNVNGSGIIELIQSDGNAETIGIYPSELDAKDALKLFTAKIRRLGEPCYMDMKEQNLYRLCQFAKIKLEFKFGTAYLIGTLSSRRSILMDKFQEESDARQALDRIEMMLARPEKQRKGEPNGNNTLPDDGQ